MPDIHLHPSEKASKILIVDDEPHFLFGMSRTLSKAGFDVVTANNGSAGILKAQNEQPDLILLDVIMPKINGLQVKKSLDRDPLTQFIPTVFLTALADRTHMMMGLNIAEDYVTKPVDTDILILRLKTILRRTDRGYKLAIQDSKKVIFLNAHFDRWGQAVEVLDNGTAGHTKRVTHWCVALARSLGITGEELVNARRGAMLHDIGKLAIPEYILGKPGPLTQNEWAIMREHPAIAVEMLKDIDILLPALNIPHYHHERWDGKGYPVGLSGEAIPILARIFSVVDVYDALLTIRPYKQGIDEETALKMIRTESGTHFDPDIVDHFLAHLNTLKKEVADEYITDDSDHR